MKDDGALLQHAPYFGNTEEMVVKLADLKFLKEWKKPRPALIAEDVRTQLLPSQSHMLEQEVATAQAQCALYEKYKEFQGCSNVLHGHNIFLAFIIYGFKLPFLSILCKKLATKAGRF